ncbi:4-beta-xylosidase [Streptomyces azureus]|uniref:4-beta-xylosidase n=1 Tax=Streptomyces azureus TaxID=146537 RepID=A0A0K8PRG9_STRAJ|nr:4-beta-xylosidase [Streptomyces azureus]
MIRVPDAPIDRLTGAWRHRADTGRVDCALRCCFRGLAEPACTRGWLVGDAGGVGCVLRCCFRGLAEPVCTRGWLAGDAGRVDRPVTLSRHEVTLVELTPVVDETSLWWDEWRLPGREAA